MIKSQTYKAITQYNRQMMVKARTVLAKDSKSIPKITKMTRDEQRNRQRADQKLPRKTQSSQTMPVAQKIPKLPRFAQSCPKITRVGKNESKPRKASKEISGTTHSYPRTFRATKSYLYLRCFPPLLISKPIAIVAQEITECVIKAI